MIDKVFLQKREKRNQAVSQENHPYYLKTRTKVDHENRSLGYHKVDKLHFFILAFIQFFEREGF